MRTLKDWLAGAEIAAGPVFRPLNRHGHVPPKRLSDKAVARVVKHTVLAAKATAAAAGKRVLGEHLDPRRHAGHSLRAGFITNAAAANVPTRDLMRQSDHTREGTLHELVRHATVFGRTWRRRSGSDDAPP